jgi:hypothetical protein
MRKIWISIDLPDNPNDSELEYESNEEYDKASDSEDSSDDEEEYFFKLKYCNFRQTDN